MIQTNRLTIRPWNDAAADVEIYLKLANDVGYTCFSMPGQFGLTVETAKERLQDRLDLYSTKQVGKFLVQLKDSGEPVGTCGLGAYELDGQEVMELGYRFCLKHWGKGYATETSQAMLKYGFQELGLKKIFAFAIKENPVSIRVIEKLGFKFLRQFDHAGFPHQLYQMTNDRFFEKKADTLPVFNKVDCVMFKVDSIENGLKFYSEKMGHEVIWKTKTAAGLRLPDCNSELVVSTENGPETDLKVTDTRVAYEKLLKAGAKSIVAPFEIQIGFCAVVEDPWGNVITLLDTSKGLVRVDEQMNVIGNETPASRDLI